MKFSRLIVLFVCCFVLRVQAQTLAAYQATITNQNPTAYFKLDSSLASAVDGSVVLEPNIFVSGYGYASDVFRNASNSFFFFNQTDYLRDTTHNLINGGGPTNATPTGTGSITFLFRSLDILTNSGQRYLFSGGGSTVDGNALTLFVENNNPANGDTNSVKLRFGSSTITVLNVTNMAPSTWYYFALTYDESRIPDKARWYVGKVGGTLASGSTVSPDYAVAGDDVGVFVIGNHTNYSNAYRNPGNGRIDEFAFWNRELSFSEITNQYGKLPLSLTNGIYDDVVASQSPAHYFKLNNSLVDSIDGSLTFTTTGDTGGAFTTNVLGQTNSAYKTIATNDALVLAADVINGGGPGADGGANKTGSFSFLFRTLGDTNIQLAKYIFNQGTGTSATRNQLALYMEGTNAAGTDINSLRIRGGNTTKTVLLGKDILTNTWYYFAMTWDETRNSAGGGEVRYYIGPVGQTLTPGTFDPANDSVIGDNGTITLLNRAALNMGYAVPNDGAIDNFATWNEELTLEEVTAQFNAALNSGVVLGMPILNISNDGGKVIISWPSSTAGSFGLESTTILPAPSWNSEGAASVVGSDFVITNTITGNKFYRLRSP